MHIARIAGHVVSVHKHSAYVGKKLLLVQLLDAALQSSGDPVVAVDMVDAGAQDLVLVTSEGGWAREQFGKDTPIRSTIVAIVAGVDVKDG